jgi:hypothetical protein
MDSAAGNGLIILGLIYQSIGAVAFPGLGYDLFDIPGADLTAEPDEIQPFSFW